MTKIAATLVLALALHLLLGWSWTLLAGVAGGFWTGRRGWLIGLLGVGLEWLLLLVYTYLVDAQAAGAMAGQLGGILGNLPGLAIVGLTLLIGILMGTLGGALGGILRQLIATPHSNPSPITR